METTYPDYEHHFCSLEKSVADNKFEINNSLKSDSLYELKDRSDIAQRQLTALNDVERDVQNRVHENRQILTKEIHDQVDRSIDVATTQYADLKNQLRDFEINAAKEFATAAVEAAKNTGILQLAGAQQTSVILEKMAGDKYDNMKDKIDALREECERGKWQYALAAQNAEFASLKNMINSVDQNQRFASKTVQFGTGNTAGTAQTANQG